MSNIAVLIMVKNEENNILKTLNSVLPILHSLIIYDTGSVDDTLNVIKNFCTENNILLYLKKGKFIDFSTSRNIALKFADEIKDIDFILLLDANDELHNHDSFIKFCNINKNSDKTAFLIPQLWNHTKYYNIRLIKPRYGWNYKGVVHEYITNEKYTADKISEEFIFYIYQDRNGEKTDRYERDRRLLEKQFLINPNDTRTIFYLAQTYFCLKDFISAYKFYKLRTTKSDGFYEEKFLSFYYCGEISSILKNDWDITFAWYMKSYIFIRRVEPLVKIAEYYISIKQLDIAYMYLKTACSLDYPTNLLLFVDSFAYNYKRWHLLGIVSYYVNKIDDGLLACNTALSYNPNSEIDKHNLRFYTS